MAAPQGPFLAAVLLLVTSGLYGSSSSPACPQSCTCRIASLVNCSSSGLSSVPQHIQDSVTELDLSHNLLNSVTLHRPHPNLRNLWLGNNSVTHLSLCMEENHTRQYLRGRHRLRPRSGQGCVSWASALQLLSVERNQLEQLPEGLEGIESLQVMRLSYNRISTLRPGDLSHLRQLKELDLKHNLITSLHPQMFQDLVQLRVLDLSFNMLTSLHPLTYLNLRNTGVDTRLGGNRWQCDCRMRSLRRRMAYDNSKGLQTWTVMCASPAFLSGRDLLQLEEDDLKCFSPENSPELHQDVTLYRGSEILLYCSAQDSMWWTSSGQSSVNQPQSGLLISDITKKDTGLYVCVSEGHQVVSVYNLQINEVGGARRERRDLPGTSQQIIPEVTLNRIGEVRNLRATQSDLTLAVCLSVFITFLVAFILGVLARPFIDVLWKRVTKKKRSNATNSVSDVEQRQYDNEAFSHGEGAEVRGNFRERRVTFSTVDYIEDSNVQYYDTVASGDQEGIDNDDVFECGAAEAEKHTAGDSGSESSLHHSSPQDGRRLSGDTRAGCTRNMEFEPIPDPVELEERRSLSSSSDCSLSDKGLKGAQMSQRDHTKHKSPHLVVDSVQQKAGFSTDMKVEVPQISVEDKTKIPGFSSEPFADWSPHTNLTDPNLLQESEELFEFSDSGQSLSARSSSVFGSFNDPKHTVAPTSDKQNRDDRSSSSSYISDDEPTQYTVNFEMDNNQDTSLEMQSHSLDPIRPSKRPAMRPNQSFSDSSDCDDEPVPSTIKQETTDEAQRDTNVKVTPMPRTRSRDLILGVVSHSKSLDIKATSQPTAHSSSSSSESEEENTDIKIKGKKGRVSQLEKCLNVNAPLPDSNSSSSDESQTMKHMQKQGETQMTMINFQESQRVNRNLNPQWPAIDLEHIPHPKKHLHIKASSSPAANSSSSSDSEEETTHFPEEQIPGRVDVAGVQFQKSPHDSKTQLHVLDLNRIPGTTRHLDIKAPSVPSDSSSSGDSEDETTGHTEVRRTETLGTAGLTFQESQAKTRDLDTRWPIIDLQHIPRVKKRLDIKAPSPSSDSSSSSDSEDETTKHVKKKGQGELHMSQGPSEDHVSISRIKRRAPSPPPRQSLLLSCHSTSSSDSEEETRGLTEKQSPGKLCITRLPSQKSQMESHDPDARWPAIDLQHIPRIKRRLDIKAPSPSSDTSSSSDSEDETTKHKRKREQGLLTMSWPPVKVSQTQSHEPETQQPAGDHVSITHIKRRAPSPPRESILQSSHSSSSSDSEEETRGHTEKQSPGKLGITRLPSEKSQMEIHDPDAGWPAVDLQHIPQIKRRLDIKAPSPSSDTSSSSDSEEEAAHHTQREKLIIARLPSGSYDPEPRWPAIDLQHIPHIKRRLDIKAPSPLSHSPSSSDSEDGIIDHTETQRPGKLGVVILPSQKTEGYGGDATWPAVDLQRIPRNKRRLDIKAPSPSSETSSSSDSEDETRGHMKKQDQEEMQKSRLPVKVSPTVSHGPETPWPAIDLQGTTRIKRRLDVKAPSPSHSSSSSSSEDETTGHTNMQRPGKLSITRLPSQKSQMESYDLNAKWPTLDLQQIPHIKRHLDIKAPSPSSDSSSSSDSEDETTGHLDKQRAEKLGMTTFPSQSYAPDASWPVVDLQHIPRIKRRLDIKAPSPSSDSSSSSDSEEEAAHHTQREKLIIARLPSRSYDPDARWPAIDLQRIPHIKRRLDIKAPSPSSDSSSSSDSEDETPGHLEKQRAEKLGMTMLPSQSYAPDARWPVVDLQHIPPIKMRLDIKPTSLDSDSSSSSDSEDETTKHTKKREEGQLHMSRLPFTVSQTVSHEPETQQPAVDRGNITSTERSGSMNYTLEGKREEAHKVSFSHSSSSSDDQEVHMEGLSHPRLAIKPDSRWSELGFSSTLYVKRRLDIKAPSHAPESSSSSSESEDGTTDRRNDVGITSHEQQSLKKNLGVPHTRRYLDIKAPSPSPNLGLGSSTLPSQQSESNCSSTESEDENKGCKANVGKGDSVTSRASEREFIRSPQGSLMNISPSSKTDHNIKLEKYTVIPGDLGNKPANDNISTTPEINPELQSRWATMNLGYSRFRRRLEITSQTPQSPNLPSSPLPDSPLSPRSENKNTRARQQRFFGMQEFTQSDSSLILRNKPVNVSPTPTDQVVKSSNVEVKSNPATSLLQLVSNSSSTSNREDEIDHGVPDLRLGVPLVKRRLDIKAPPPEPSTSPPSSSKTENELMQHNATSTSGITDDSVITYKRVIMKSPSLPSNSFSSSDTTQSIDHAKQRYTAAEIVTVTPEHEGDKNTSLSPRRVPSMSFDDIVKKRIEQSKHDTGVNVPHEIRWTGVGHHLSDFSTSNQRDLKAALTSPQQALPAEPEVPPPESSSSESDDDIRRDSGKSNVTLMHEYSSLSAYNVTPASSSVLEKLDKSSGSTNERLRIGSEVRSERKGLSALKAMSSERQKWYTQDLNKATSPLFDDPQSDTSFNQHRLEANIRPLSKQPLVSSHLSSASADEWNALDFLHGIPRYRRHDIRNTEPPPEAPPPIPAAPLPDEAVMLTWSSPQSIKVQAWEENRPTEQQRSSMRANDPPSLTAKNLATYLDFTNISEV